MTRNSWRLQYRATVKSSKLASMTTPSITLCAILQTRASSPLSTCPHSNVRCLSEFELIRKYRCESCGAVMMCACDESIGRKFLARQLEFGAELDTKRGVPVTAGFQPRVCEECRSLPLTPH